MITEISPCMSPVQEHTIEILSENFTRVTIAFVNKVQVLFATIERKNEDRGGRLHII